MLEKINSPEDLKTLKIEELPKLAEEIREFMIKSISKTGGHLAPNLGAVEITLALHYVLNSPKDKIIWDVGHQAYIHKILTGRKDKFHTLRQYKGISGFPKVSESEHDAFGVGHSSTSLSAALGIAKARDLKGEDFEVAAIIGDGALTGGIALEGLNQIGYLQPNMILILNDNKMSISMNVGALSKYTHRIAHTKLYQRVKADIKTLMQSANGNKPVVERLKKNLKEIGTPGLVFEKLGINYIGPVDGHNVKDMVNAIEEAKSIKGPTLIHAITVKGKGYKHAEDNATKFHGLGQFNIDDGEKISCANAITYTEAFANTLVKLAEDNKKIVGITAAMPDGTGMAKFAQKFPDRFFDVGIAEQHAVTFAAGLALHGLKPVAAIYSTFLQRAYDQIIHDVCLQNLDVTFILDRAGVVGDDGPTHHGTFDLSFLRHIPHIIVMSPKDENELQHMLKTAIQYNGPAAVRYPRGCGLGVELEEPKILEIGKCEILKEGSDIVLVAIGNMVEEAVKAAEKLDATVINARFAKPIDNEIIKRIKNTGRAIIIEENTIKGGFGSAILELLNEKKVKADVKLMAIPDKFIEHGSQAQLRKDCGLTAENIVEEAMKL